MLYFTVGLPQELLDHLFSSLKQYYSDQALRTIMDYYEESDAETAILFWDNGTIKIDIEHIKESWKTYPDLKTAISQRLTEYEENKIMPELEEEGQISLQWGFKVYLLEDKEILVYDVRTLTSLPF